MSLDVNSLKCQQAIRLKYKGFKYKEISKRLGVAVPTLKGWFMSGGALYDAYKDFSQKMCSTIQDDAADQIAKNVDVAAEMIVALMGSEKDEVKFKAAVHILDRCLGKPVQQIDEQVNVLPDYETMLRMARAKPDDKKDKK